MKENTTHFSEKKSIIFYQTTRYHIPEEFNFDTHHHENSIIHNVMVRHKNIREHTKVRHKNWKDPY
jgi:hypothetical protein